jgi:uncharacterized protein (UPF0305 family)
MVESDLLVEAKKVLEAMKNFDNYMSDKYKNQTRYLIEDPAKKIFIDGFVSVIVNMILYYSDLKPTDRNTYLENLEDIKTLTHEMRNVHPVICDLLLENLNIAIREILMRFIENSEIEAAKNLH